MYVEALCSKFVVSLAHRTQAWDTMVCNMMDKDALHSLGAQWKGMKVDEKILAVR